MIFLFFPTMRILASVFVLASVSIRLDEILGFPLRALISFVFELVRLSSEVLPVVCVNTSISWMSGVTIRAPDSLKVEDIKVCIQCKFIQQINS